MKFLFICDAPCHVLGFSGPKNDIKNQIEMKKIRSQIHDDTENSLLCNRGHKVE
jgi:hypothetical protein